MQNSQEINWWLEIAKIAIPSLVALIVPFITYHWLTRRMADYQITLGKKLYEFQTRFSVLHQEKAKIVKELYAGFWDMFILCENINVDNDRSENKKKLKQKHLEILTLFSKNRLFFDDEMNDKLEKFLDEVLTLTLNLENERDNYKNFRSFAKDELLVELKKDFYKILSAENPNNQLEKK